MRKVIHASVITDTWYIQSLLYVGTNNCDGSTENRYLNSLLV